MTSNNGFSARNGDPRRHLSSAARQRARRRARGLPPRLLAHHNQRPRRTPLLAALLTLAALLALIPTLGMAAGGAYYAQVAAELKPRLAKLHDYAPFQTSRILDRNGRLLYEFISQGRRDPVKLDQISPHLINATIAIEDKHFWTNPGVDYLGIARAAYLNLTRGDIVSGGSTITQQFIKLVLLTDQERQEGYERKLKEVILAQQLTREYSKEQILELYLNEINYGNLAYGIQAAAQTYFGIDAKDLNLNQASLLAGIPQLPTLYNPMRYVDANRVLKGVQLRRDWVTNLDTRLPEDIAPPRARQVAVLREMVQNGMITEREAREAIAQDLQFADQQVPLRAPHFVFYVKELLENDPRIGPILANEGGLTITTTLDLDIQQIAEREAKRRIEELEAEGRNIHNAAVVIQQPGTGQILAMVGSIDYNAVKPTTTEGEEGNVLDGNVNVAIAERQPGSALKPFTYLSALKQGVLTPGSILWDVETRFPIRAGASERNLNKCAPGADAYWFCPKNFDNRWHGPVRMREALANSLNMPAVLALKRAGIGPTRELLHQMGISGLQREDSYYGLALTLGGGEVTLLDLTTAYNTLANDGRYVQANPILKITDRHGTVLREFQAQPNTQVVDPALVAIVRDWMGDNAARTPIFGRNNPLRLSRPAHAKTGTTDDFRDAWALGFTPYVTVGVWTGNNNNEPTQRVESTQGGGVIWNRIMEALFADPRIDAFLRDNGQRPLAFPSPAAYGAVERRICQIGGPFGQRTTEWFTPQMVERNADGVQCDFYKTVEVVRLDDGRVCLPQPGQNYGDRLVSMRVWNLPKSTDDERIIGGEFRFGDDEELVGSAPTQQCGPEAVLTPTPEPTPTPETTPTAGPGQPAQVLPNLVGLGENQAKGVLAGLGITSVVVDYQGRDRLGDLYDQFPAYAVVSHSPGPGTPIQPGMTVVLGIRAP
ncbi:transglycosylase domain-containing protein [Kallotenue papyrolyticum]|uniref:transglycosylase domain-containing protein n=1 Tax=Kallotenue papyrolyticum TaxID=1325125 RepID=UPI000492745A|nr:transglycosylase domain-containing protein [Kallotenue papyrolyticum]